MAIKNPFSRRSTTYNSSGSVEPPAGIDQEMGSSRPVIIRDTVPELVSRNQALRVYDKMWKTDAIVNVSMRTAKVSILGAEFYIDPEGDDQDANDVAEFVRYNLFEGPSAIWTYTLQKILKMYQHGNSVFEQVYEMGPWAPQRANANAKNYVLLKKLAYRPSLTITQILTDDNGGPTEVVQNAINAAGQSNEVHIPIEKAVIFSYGDADDLWGESLLRPAYPHWYYKNHLYKIDGIQKERHGIGIPYAKPPAVYTEDDKKFLEELLQNIRTNERSFIIEPPGYEIGFKKPEGQLVDVLKSAEYHDVAIMLNVMAAFMMAGFEGSSGGRATSGSQTDVFYKANLSIASFICDCFNTYIISNLVHWNFDTTVVPKMKVRSIGQSRDLQQIAAALGNVFGQDILTADDETENWVRTTIFDMPTRKTPRPEVTPNNIREQILLQGKQGADPNAPTTTGTSTSQKGKVGNNGGGGNLGKGPTDG